MTSRTPVDFSDNAHVIAAALADKSDLAYQILRELIALHKGDPKVMLFDFYDMNVRGEQIVTALDICKTDYRVLARLINERDYNLVEALNKQHGHEHIARVSGEQTRVNPVDVAVAATTTQNQIIARLDEGSEAVHNFFINLLRRMQAENKFTINMRVNLGLESGHCMTFVIAAAELLDKDGKPVEMQPTKENERVNTEIAQQTEAHTHNEDLV